MKESAEKAEEAVRRVAEADATTSSPRPRSSRTSSPSRRPPRTQAEEGVHAVAASCTACHDVFRSRRTSNRATPRSSGRSGARSWPRDRAASATPVASRSPDAVTARPTTPRRRPPLPRPHLPRDRGEPRARRGPARRGRGARRRARCCGSGSRPRLAVVLGASGRLDDDVDVDALPGRRRARSPGGRAAAGTVVVGPGALNVTVVLPADAAPGLDAVDTAQAYVLGRLAAAIRGRGPAVEVRGSGDLTLGGRKFAGSAQRRLRRSFPGPRQHPLSTSRSAPIVRYTRLPRRQPAYRAGRPHESFLTNLDLPRADLLAAVRSAWPADPVGAVDAVPIPDDLVGRLVAGEVRRPGLGRTALTTRRPVRSPTADLHSTVPATGYDQRP